MKENYNFIVKVPGINGLGKTNGCEKAPNEILKTIKEIYSSELKKEIKSENFDLEEIHLDNEDIEKSLKLIYENSFNIYEEKDKTIFLGGDHSISYSLTRAFFDYCENNGKEPCLIVFDAHADCMPAMQEPTHEEWLRKLIDDGFPTQNILLVGVRNMWKSEDEFLKEKNIRMIDLNRLNENLEEVCEAIMEFANKKELYLSIDIDVVDPAFAPGTGYKEPGGLTSRQFLHLVQRLNKVKTLRAIDLVEINPEKDKDGLTLKLGAKVLAELV